MVYNPFYVLLSLVLPVFSYGFLHLCSSGILTSSCIFLQSVKLWHQGNAGLIKQVWKYSLDVLKEFEKE
jgi:hypothetical protein